MVLLPYQTFLGEQGEGHPPPPATTIPVPSEDATGFLECFQQEPYKEEVPVDRAGENLPNGEA